MLLRVLEFPSPDDGWEGGGDWQPMSSSSVVSVPTCTVDQSHSAQLPASPLACILSDRKENILEAAASADRSTSEASPPPRQLKRKARNTRTSGHGPGEKSTAAASRARRPDKLSEKSRRRHLPAGVQMLSASSSSSLGDWEAIDQCDPHAGQSQACCFSGRLHCCRSFSVRCMPIACVSNKVGRLRLMFIVFLPSFAFRGVSSYSFG